MTTPCGGASLRLAWVSEAAQARPRGELTSSEGVSTLRANKCSYTPTFREEARVLTGRQQQIYDFVVGYVDRHGYPPTVREIGEAIGLASPSTVHAHLANLERAGYVRRDPTKPRALELLARERAVASTGRAR